MARENFLELAGNDEMRLHVLMSALPVSRDINPLQYDSCLGFWTSRLENYCRSRNSICFNFDEVFRHFTLADKQPWSLPDVVRELLKLGKIVDQQTMASKFSWSAWTAKYFIWHPIKLLASARSYLPLQQQHVQNEGRPQVPTEFLNSQLFFPGLIEEFSKSLEPKLEANLDSFESVFSAEEFHANYLSTVECQYTKQYLVELWKSRGIIRVGVIKSQTVYKLGKLPVTENDANLLQVKISIKNFEERIVAREKEHEEIMAKVRSSLAAGNKNEAKRLLRQAKVMREEIDKFRIALERLHDAKFSIETVVHSAQVVDAVQSGTDVMKIFASPKKVEEANNVLEDLEEQHALAKELSSAISTPASPPGFDMSALEDELAALTASSDHDVIDSVLPKVPTQIPELPNTPTTSVLKKPSQDLSSASNRPRTALQAD